MPKKSGSEKGAKRAVYNVSPQEFARVWAEAHVKGETVEYVAKVTGIPRLIVLARACNYRKAGIKLGRLRKPSSRGLPVEEINKLIERVEKEQREGKKSG